MLGYAWLVLLQLLEVYENSHSQTQFMGKEYVFDRGSFVGGFIKKVLVPIFVQLVGLVPQIEYRFFKNRQGLGGVHDYFQNLDDPGQSNFFNAVVADGVFQFVGQILVVS